MVGERKGGEGNYRHGNISHREKPQTQNLLTQTWVRTCKDELESDLRAPRCHQEAGGVRLLGGRGPTDIFYKTLFFLPNPIGGMRWH